MKLTKLFKGDPTRKTRLHTGRGELLPLENWIDIPRAVLQRTVPVTRRGGPWMAPTAVSFLDSVIKADWRVFEFGSGVSTQWYAERAGHIVSVEDQNEWYETMRKNLLISGRDNYELHLLPRQSESFPSFIAAYPDDYFDLIVVDGLDVKPGDRISCIRIAKSKVRHGGLLVLDDSDRREYSEADSLLRGWEIRRFRGIKPYPLIAIETTIYQR